MSSQTRTDDRRIVWSDLNLDIEDWREGYKEYLEANELDLDPDDERAIYDWMVETNGEYLSDERMNLDIQLSQPIIVIGDLGRWNGRVMGYKMVDSGNIKDCLYSDTDFTEWYVDRYGDLRADAVHHDGTNHYLYRVFKEGVTEVRGVSFVEAVETLMGRAAILPSAVCAAPQKEVSKVLLLPERSPTTERVTEYLFGRGIDYGIIESCISQGLIYESLPYHNAVFVGYDRERKPRYAAFRAANSSRIMGDCSGSDKHYSFRIADGKSDELHLFECAIDLLSYATLEVMAGRDWRANDLVSLSGVYLSKKRPEESKTPMALSQF